MILFGDRAVPRAAVAQLVVRLDEIGETDLAGQIGIAIDENRESFVIPRDDYPTVIRLLERAPIVGLEPLIDALRPPGWGSADRGSASAAIAT